MYKHALALILAFVISSCISSPDSKTDYSGYSEKQLIDMWGVPTGNYTTNDGSLYLEFKSSYDAGGNTYSCTRNFTLKNNKVVAWKRLGYC